MAVVEREIIAGGGGDYTTIAAWEAATDLNSGADIWKGVISDDSNYDEHVTIDIDGTSTSSYVWLDVASANRHSGVPGTSGHARMKPSTGGHTLTITGDYAQVTWLDIGVAFSSNHDFAVQLDGLCENVLLSHLIVVPLDGNRMNGIGKRFGTGFTSVSIDNCHIAGFRGAGVYIATADDDETVNVDHCVIQSIDAPNTVSGYFQIGDGTNTANIYNSVIGSNPTDGNSSTTANLTLNGSHNLANLTDWPLNGQGSTTDNTTNWQDASDGFTDTTKASGSWCVVTDIGGIYTDEIVDSRLLDDEAGNLAAGNGTDRQGSEPDSRQDFSVDITGGSRPTSNVDIGPHQVTTAGGTPGSASPATTGLSFSIPQATAASPGSASPDEISPTVSVPAPGVAGSAVAEPDEISPTLSIETPTPAGAAVATPDAVSTSFTIPTPTPVEGEDAGTAQPDAISPTLTLPAPTPAGAAVATPDQIAVTVVMPAPSAKGAGVVAPDEIAVAVSMGAVTVEGGAVVTPDTIALTLTLPQATADGQVPAELIAQVINSTFGRQVVTGSQIRQAITGDTFIS